MKNVDNLHPILARNLMNQTTLLLKMLGSIPPKLKIRSMKAIEKQNSLGERPISRPRNKSSLRMHLPSASLSSDQGKTYIHT